MHNVIVNAHARRVKKIVAAMEERFREHGVQYAFSPPDRREMPRHLRVLFRKRASGSSSSRAATARSTKSSAALPIPECARGACPRWDGQRLCREPADSARDPRARSHSGSYAAARRLHRMRRTKEHQHCRDGIDVEILRRCAGMRFGTNKGKYFRSLVATARALPRNKAPRDRERRDKGILCAHCGRVQRQTAWRRHSALSRGKGGRRQARARRRGQSQTAEDSLRAAAPHARKTSGASHYPPYSLFAGDDFLADGPIFVQYDGEIGQTQTLDARLVSGKLKMYRG